MGNSTIKVIRQTTKHVLCDSSQLTMIRGGGGGWFVAATSLPAARPIVRYSICAGDEEGDADLGILIDCALLTPPRGGGGGGGEGVAEFTDAPEGGGIKRGASFPGPPPVGTIPGGFGATEGFPCDPIDRLSAPSTCNTINR